MPQHLEGHAARADDDTGTQLGDGYGALGEQAADLVARAQVLGQLVLLVAEPTEVEDALHAGAGGRVAHRRRAGRLTRGEVGLTVHRVDEEQDRIDAGAGDVHRGPVGHVAADDVDAVAPDPSIELRRRAHGAADRVPRGEQLRDDAPADVAGGSEHEHVHDLSSSCRGSCCRGSCSGLAPGPLSGSSPGNSPR